MDSGVTDNPSSIYMYVVLCSLVSNINVTLKGVYLAISKLQSILVVANLLAHNNTSQICYYGQLSLQSAAAFLTHLVVTFILLAMVHAFSKIMSKLVVG